MKMKTILKYILGLICLVICLQSQAQSERTIGVFPSEKGNYLQFVSNNDLVENLELIKNTKHFEIQRVIVKNKNSRVEESDFKTIAKVEKAFNSKELETIYSKKIYDEIKSVYQFEKDKEMNDYYAQHYKLEDFPFINTMVETHLALGYMYLDLEPKEGSVCYYRVNRVDKNNEKSLWGMTVVHTGVGNYLLNKVHLNWANSFATDSSVTLQWAYTIDSTPQPEQIDDPNIFNKEDAKFMTSHYIIPQNLKAAVYVLKEGVYVKQEDLISPTVDSTEKNIIFNFFMDALPEDVVHAYIVPQDFVYNSGLPSDTALAIAVTNYSTEQIYGINVVDTLNGIHISWDQLPNKPYYVGIEVGRYDEEDTLEVIASLTPEASYYVDRNIVPGVHYRYAVRPVFLPIQDLEQKVPASGVGTYTKFDNPLPAFELIAQNADEDILLKWNNADELSIYGFYVYRGLTDDKMELVAGPIKDSMYLDTSSSLRSRSTYFYSISAQNLSQDTSIFSNVVIISPNRPALMEVPSYIKFYYVNGNLNLSWNDTRTEDNFIEFFELQRKVEGESNFKQVTPNWYALNTYEDQGISDDKQYIYRVRSIGADSSKGEFSPEFSFAYKNTELLNEIDVFTLRNTKNGIKIILPSVLDEDVKEYRIYKRKVDETKPVLVKTLKNNEFTFEDTAVQNNVVYVYSILAIDNENREGKQGRERSLRVNKL